MQTSTHGRAFLEVKEGVVLKSYRDVAGVWTIGAGLTAASGVVTPVAGMQISRDQASALLSKALRLNYEPDVARAMPNAKQYEFDAGVDFHFNTGAIRRASWAALWRGHARPGEIRAKMMLWVKGGGKVLPGLEIRRREEADILLLGKYPDYITQDQAALNPVAAAMARWAIPMTDDAKAAAYEAFKGLGYAVGAPPFAILSNAAKAFQQDHDLTVDGIIGRATLSTLQRAVDARRKTKVALTAGVAVAPLALLAMVDGLPSVSFVAEGGVALRAVYLAWHYRDSIGAVLQPSFPRLAACFRSF